MEKTPAVLSKFAKKLRYERTQRGFSQETLAAAAKVSRNYIGMIERGESNLTLGTMDQIAKALRMEVWETTKYLYQNSNICQNSFRTHNSLVLIIKGSQ